MMTDLLTWGKNTHLTRCSCMSQVFESHLAMYFQSLRSASNILRRSIFIRRAENICSVATLQLNRHTVCVQLDRAVSSLRLRIDAPLLLK